MTDMDRRGRNGEDPFKAVAFSFSRAFGVEDISIILQDYPYATPQLRKLFEEVNYYVGEPDPARLRELFEPTVREVVHSYPNRGLRAIARLRGGDFDGALDELEQFTRDFQLPACVSELYLDEIIATDDFSLLVQAEAKRVLEEELIKTLPAALNEREPTIRSATNIHIRANKILRDETQHFSLRTMAARLLYEVYCGYTESGLLKVLEKRPPLSADETQREQWNLVRRAACATLRSHMSNPRILTALVTFQSDMLFEALQLDRRNRIFIPLTVALSHRRSLDRSQAPDQEPRQR